MKPCIKIAAVVVSAGFMAFPYRNAIAAIEEVIVTAQKRKESVQETPIAITSLSSDTLENRGALSYDSVVKASPSITFTTYPSSSNTLILFMRGQGISDVMQVTAEGAVGLYQNGFYISRPQASTFDLADVERVEILRGPQGTLYGRNTTGGAVNIISKAPSGEFDLKQTLSFGSRNLFRSLTVVDLPSWQSVSTKLSWVKSSKDGYVKNAGTGRDFGEEAQEAGRLALRWDASDNFSVDYFLEKGELDSAPLYYQNASWSDSTIVGPLGSYVYPSANHPLKKTARPVDLKLSTSDYTAHGLTLSWDITDSLTLKSLTGYRELDWLAYMDYVESFAYVSGPSFIIPLIYQSDDLVRQHQFSQEVQMLGDTMDGRVEYLVGAFYSSESASHTQENRIPTFGTVSAKDVSAEAESRALYTQVSWTPQMMDQRLKLSLGARYTEDDRSAKRFLGSNGAVLENGAYLDKTYKRFNPAFIINYTWGPDISTYAKASTGYRAGGFSEGAPIGHFVPYDPEDVTAYELGLKSYWFEKAIRLNIAIFESRFKDMQIDFQVDPADPSVIQAQNAGSATVRGVEAELLFAPTNDLSLTVDYAYLDPVFDRVDALPGTVFDPSVNPASPYVVGQNIKNLFHVPQSPKQTIALTMDYTAFRFDRGNVSLYLDYRFQSKIYTTYSTGPDVPGRDLYSTPAYGVWNGRITTAFELAQGSEVKVSLWGKNITDKEYPMHATAFGNLIATPGSEAGYYSRAVPWSEPATYGIDIQFQY